VLNILLLLIIFVASAGSHQTARRVY